MLWITFYPVASKRSIQRPSREAAGLSAALKRQLRNPAVIRRLNLRLLDALAALPGQRLQGVRIRPALLHLERGHYTRGDGYGDHCHEDVQVEFPLSGRFSFQVESRMYDVGPGQALVIAPTRTHRWRCEEAGFMIGATVLVEDVEDSAAVNRLRADAHLAARQVTPDGGITRWCALLQALARPSMTPWALEETSAYMAYWIVHVFRAYAATTLGQPAMEGRAETREARLVKMALSYIRSNHARKIDAQEVAHHVGLSVRHLNRLFRREREESIYHAVLETRLKQAYENLSSESPPSVKAVAYTCGFSSPSHFSRTFLKRFGRLPSALRQI